MTGSLFRPEVIEAQRRRLWGEVIVVQPVSHAVVTGVLALITVTALTYLVTGTYAKTETVQGYIAPTGGLAQVYATHGGIISAVLVHEGDFVTKGQALIELSLDTATATGPAGEKLRAQTQSRITEVDKEIAAATTRYQDEAKRLAVRIEGIKAELSNLDRRLSSEGETLRLQEDASNRVAALEAEGYRTTLELNQRQQQVTAERSTIHALEQQREQRRGDLRDIQAQLSTLPIERADKLAQLQSARSELEQALIQLEINQSYEMVAPVSGRIAAMQATPGQATTNQTPLVGLVPEGADLEANLLVPSRAVGLIQPEQEVRVRLDAFPYQRFGVVMGHVSQMAKSTYRPGELLAPIQYQDTVYRVVIGLEKTRMKGYGEDRSLTPGMTLMADIITDRRHFIDWVLDPLRAISLKN